MFVYKEYFNAGVSIYISHITIFTCATNSDKSFIMAEGNLQFTIYNLQYLQNKFTKIKVTIFVKS